MARPQRRVLQGEDHRGQAVSSARDSHDREWTLQGGFDGKELFARPSIQVLAVTEKPIEQAVAKIAGCEYCRADKAELPFDWILANVLDRPGPYEFILTRVAQCPNCRASLTEKTLVEPRGGIGADIAS